MPYEPVDLGRILQTAEAIKGARRQGAIDQLQQQYLSTNIAGAQQQQGIQQQTFDQQQQERTARMAYYKTQAILSSADPKMAAESIAPDLVQQWEQTHGQGSWASLTPQQAVQVAQMGQQRALSVIGPQQKVKWQDAGGTLIPVDETTGQPIRGTSPIEKTASPDSRLSASTALRGQDITMRGQNLTDARERDKIKQTGNQQYQTNAGKLRDDYSQLVSKTGWHDLQGFYQRMQQTAADPSPAGDIGLIFSYMKVLDPNSTVREGEYATAANAGSAFAKVGSVYNKVINGQRLTEGQRADFFKKAGQYYETAQNRQKAIEADFTNKAKHAGIDPSDVLVNYGAPTVVNGWSVQEVK